MPKKLEKKVLSLGTLIVWVLGCSTVFGGTSSESRDTAARKSTAESPLPGLAADRAAALKALGYFDRAETANPQDRSVTKEKAQSCGGLSLYGSRHRSEAFLIDAAGEVVHKWKSPEKRPPWMHMVMQRDGSLLVIAKPAYVAKLDWNSKVLWKRKMGAHHDVITAPDGNIYVLTHTVTRYKHRGVEVPIMDDSVVVLSPAGEELRKQRLYPVLRSLVSTHRLNRLAEQAKAGVSTRKLVAEGAPGDVLHTNSLEVLARPIPGIAPAGAVLMSVREINRIVIVDSEMKKLLWSWGEGELQAQHHATHLKNGNILLFDNGIHRKKSRVIELDPITGKIVWSFEKEGFYSQIRGSAQKLDCGNVLTVESDKGHALEVTPDGRVVWEFWNPDVQGGDSPTRAVIYRMTRYPDDFLNKGLLPAK